MKIEGPSPLRPTSSVRAKRAYGTSSATAASGAPPSVDDTASIMGIPEAELTPKVRDAIYSLMQEVHQLRGEVDSLRAQLAEAQGLADQDVLLPIFNRRAFLRELSRVTAFAERYQSKAALIYFDLNGFKQINDAHGHAAGDEVLLTISEILTKNVRSSDVVGRLGGDEFGVLLARAPRDAARQKADLLKGLIEDRTTSWEGHELRIGVSFGVFVIDEKMDAHAVLAAADREMYADKRSKSDER